MVIVAKISHTYFLYTYISLLTNFSGSSQIVSIFFREKYIAYYILDFRVNPFWRSNKKKFKKWAEKPLLISRTERRKNFEIPFHLLSLK